MPIKHKFASAKADGADPTRVRASNWNDTYVTDYAITPVNGNYSVQDMDEKAHATEGSGGITVTFPSAVNRAGCGFGVVNVVGGAGAGTAATTARKKINDDTSYSMIGK